MNGEAKRLRAELAASQELAAALSDEHEEVEKLAAELDASEASCDRLRDAYDQIRVLNVGIANAGAASCATLRDERDAARQDAERMREALAELICYLPDIVKNAMLVMWREICADTGCHPLDIEHGKSKFLTFEPRHWAQMTGNMVATNARAALQVATAAVRRDASEWQPLETAPKMKNILMWAATDITDTGEVKNWKMETGFWSNGLMDWIWGGYAVGNYSVRPTHWMPLPELPRTTAADPAASEGAA